MTVDVAIAKFLHVMGAALWFGSAFFVTRFLSPVAAASGPAGGQVMGGLLLRTRFPMFMPTVGLVTIAAGFYLYWRLAYFAGDQAALGLITLNIGVLAGMVMLLIGLFVQTPTTMTMRLLAGQVEHAEGPPDAETLAELERLGGKQVIWGKASVAAGTVALLGMGLFRYL